VVGKLKAGIEMDISAGVVFPGGIVHVMKSLPDGKLVIKVPPTSLGSVNAQYPRGSIILGRCCFEVTVPGDWIEMSPIRISYKPSKNKIYLFVVLSFL